MAEDKTPPVLTCNDFTNCVGPVTFPLPTATDNCTGAIAIACSPTNGSTFAAGTTVVSCTATDASGNVASCTFNVVAVEVTALTADQGTAPGGLTNYVCWASNGVVTVTATLNPPITTNFPGCYSFAGGVTSSALVHTVTKTNAVATPFIATAGTSAKTNIVVVLKVEFKTNELIRPLHEQTLDAETWLTDDTFDKTRMTWSITKVEGVDATIDQDGDVTFGQEAGIYTLRAESSDLDTCYDEFTLMVLDWVLGAHSSAGPGDSMTAGHAWITITDFSSNPPTWVGLGLYADTSTPIVNLGLANGDGTDVRSIDAAYGLYNRYFFLNPQEKQALATYISPVRHWTYWYTCASFAEGAIMAATGEDVDADDILGFETPREYGESIQQLEASDPTAKLNPLNGGQVDTSSASSSFPNP